MNAPARRSVDCMRLTARGLAFAAGLALPLAFAAGSYAQPAPQGAPSAAPWSATDHHHHRSPEDMAAKHAARLRTLLQLRPDQEPALTAFLASMKPGGGMMRHEHEDMKPGGGMMRHEHEERSADEALPAPERMQRMLARMDEARADMSHRLDALKAFYSQLTPAQQKAFDALDMGRGHGQGHGGGPGRHGAGHDRDGMTGGHKPGD
jgi:protein CpxP